eukprot:4163599-Pyramimonas_sp.AAC.1
MTFSWPVSSLWMSAFSMGFMYIGSPPMGVVLMRRWEWLSLWARPSLWAAVLPRAEGPSGLVRRGC